MSLTPSEAHSLNAENSNAVDSLARWITAVENSQGLLIVAGPPGSGKTKLVDTITTILSNSPHPLARISIDQIRQDLFEKNGEMPTQEQAWEAFEEAKNEALKDGKTVLADATFSLPNQRTNWPKEAASLGIPSENIQRIWINVSEQTAIEGTRHRDHIDNASGSNGKAVKAWFSRNQNHIPNPESDQDWIFISRTDFDDDSVNQALFDRFSSTN